MVSKSRETIGIAVALSLVTVLSIKAQDQGTPSVPVKSSYQFPVAEEDFSSFFRRISADKPAVHLAFRDLAHPVVRRQHRRRFLPVGDKQHCRIPPDVMRRVRWH